MAEDTGTGRLESLLKECVVRITDRGTGFFVAPGWILTCAHLFPKREPVADFEWKQYKGKAKVVNCADPPDLACLRVTEWSNGAAEDHPCVMILDQNPDRAEDRFFVFGHPGDRSFGLHGKALRFEYVDSDFNNDNVQTVRVKGDDAREGFSGSPLLNLRTGEVRGILSIREGSPTVGSAIAVAASVALRQFPELPALQKDFHSRDTRWSSLLPGSCLWTEVLLECKKNVGAIKEDLKEADKDLRVTRADELHVTRADELYVKRAIEEHFATFLASDRSAMVIIGQSGMGKTTLIQQLLKRYILNDSLNDPNNLAMMFASSSFPSQVSDVERTIVSWLSNSDHEPAKFWDLINKECISRSKSLILFIDAVNEFSSSVARPVDFLLELNRIIGVANKRYRGIKYVITCRPETWNKGVEQAKTLFITNSKAYFAQDGKLAYHLSRFSAAESRLAFDKHRQVYRIVSEYNQLSELAKYLLEDPLLLRLAASVYQNMEIPADLDSGEVFREYYKNLDKEQHAQEMKDLIQAIVAEMFAPIENFTNSETIQRDAITRDIRLAGHNQELFKQLDLDTPGSPGFALKQRNILREWRLPEDSSVQIRFAYDRFAEYLFSLELQKRINSRIANMKEDRKSATVRIVDLNLESSRRLNTVHGALQQIALVLLKNHPDDFAATLREIANLNSGGMSLVISVLARTARTSPNGINLLESLLARLKRDEARAGNTLPAFPIIDAVYRVIRNEEYRLWLRTRKDEEQQTHLNTLYEYFRWGFQHKDETVSEAAIRYLFFLWQSNSHWRDANAITKSMVDSVPPLSTYSLLGTVLKNGDTPDFRRIKNLFLVFSLVLGELRDDGTAGTGDDPAKLARCAARSFIRRLKGSPTTRFLLKYGMAKKLRFEFRDQPHPVKLTALDAFISHAGQDKERLAQALSLLDGATAPSFTEIKKMLSTQNGILIQLVTFGLSTWYERNSDGKRQDYLQLAQRLFWEEGEPKAEYCASLALYHINYFGRHATAESMKLMGSMADHILTQRHGVFELAGKEETFNIIGTYGRALLRNGNLLGGENQQHETTRALQYAIDALTSAKQRSDARHYEYICQDIGLLGILSEPGQVFDVITHIIREIPDGDSGQGVFSSEANDKIKNIVVQSLANIRALYRAEVDRYLLDTLESPDLYTRVASMEPEFNTRGLYSWACEQLMFRVLTEYYNEIGDDVVNAIRDGSKCKSVDQSINLFVGRVIDKLGEIA